MTLKQESMKAVAPRRTEPKSRGKRDFFLPSVGSALSFLRTLASARVVKPQDELSSVLKNDKISGRNKKSPPSSLKAQGKKKGRKTRLALGVQRIDLVRVPASHHVAFHFHGGGELVVFLGEITVQDIELLNGFRVGNRRVGVIDRVLDLSS